MISYIVSAYDRPAYLTCCLASLCTQEGASEIIICDNSGGIESRALATLFGCRYLDTSQLGVPLGATCYHDLSYVEPKGDWLCFPSDDSYYVPQFAHIMLAYAAKSDWEYVYCDMLYDPRLAHATTGVQDTYSIMATAPSPGSIDKTNFMVTRKAFDRVGGWPQHEADWRDGALAVALVQSGVRHGKAPGIMCVHN
jgi:hypothetical protein